MRVGSLFSGVGGFDLGFEQAGHEIVWQVEFDADCQAILRHRFPRTAVKSDINAYAYGRAKNRRKHGLILPPVDIVVGGFPCQDVSIAGQRKGLAGSRSGLFFALIRLLRVLNPKPLIVILENVPGLLSGRDSVEVPNDTCLCGRPYRRRGLLVDWLSDEEEDGHVALLREVGRGDDGTRHSHPQRSPRGVRRIASCDARTHGKMGASVDVDTRRKATARAAADAPSVSTHQARTGHAADESFGRGRQARDIIGRSSVESSRSSTGINATSAGMGTACPACGQDVGEAATVFVQSAWMGTVAREMAECGYRVGHRVLDSQYFGLAQRRKRVFIVGCARTAHLDPAEILFESAGRAGDSSSRRASGPRVAASLRGRSSRPGVNEPGRGGEDDDNLICFDWQSGGDVRHNCSSSSSSSLQRSQTPAVLVPSVDVFPISGDAAAGRSGEAETLSPDAEGRRRLRPPSLGIGKAGSPSFTVSAGSVPAIAATLNAGGNDGGFRTEPGEHLVLTGEGERERALTGSMFKRHDDDTDTLIPVANTLQSNSGRRKIEETMIPVVPTLDRSLGHHRGSVGVGDFCVAAPVTASAGHHGHSSPRGDGQDNLIPFEQETAFALRRDPGGIGQAHNTTFPNGVRRLTPLECERLQGFPDGWTCLCGYGHLGSKFCTCPDTPRYKQMGNAVSVPVARWIAERIPVAATKVGIA